MANVHFVGSVALDTPEEVFAVIGEHCGPYLKRIPDGEPGGRRLWISFQIPVLRANPSLVQVGEGQIPLKLADGVQPDRSIGSTCPCPSAAPTGRSTRR